MTLGVLLVQETHSLPPSIELWLNWRTQTVREDTKILDVDEKPRKRWSAWLWDKEKIRLSISQWDWIQWKRKVSWCFEIGKKNTNLSNNLWSTYKIISRSSLKRNVWEKFPIQVYKTQSGQIFEEHQSKRRFDLRLTWPGSWVWAPCAGVWWQSSPDRAPCPGRSCSPRRGSRSSPRSPGSSRTRWPSSSARPGVVSCG